MSDFEPKMVGFLCNWCSYAGADLAGVSRFQYPTNLRSIRVLCSTRVTPHIILEVLKAGADGVLVGGCHLGDCHYISGNYYTEKRMKVTKQLLEMVGLDPRRVRLEWVSASEGERFAEVVTDFVSTLKDLGPSPVKGDEEKALRLDAAIAASQDWRLRLLNGKEIKVTEKGNAYGNTIDPGRIEELTSEAAKEEFERSMIIELTSKQPYSVKELAERIGVSPRSILENVAFLRGNNLLSLASVDGFTPKYRALGTGGA